MPDKVTIAQLQQMKRDGKKIAGVVAWDTPMARIADRAGVDLVSVGDSVGVNLWGHDDPLQVTMDEMLVVCKAVRRGVTRALVSCDLPYGPAQDSPDAALRAAQRLVKDGGADMIKVDAAADFPDAVRALVKAGIPVFAQFGLTPQTAAKFGIPYSAQNSQGGAGHRRGRRPSSSRKRKCWRRPAPARSISPTPGRWRAPPSSRRWRSR